MTETGILETLKIAAPSGLALAVFFYIIRQVLKRETFSKEQYFFAVLGIVSAGYLAMSAMQTYGYVQIARPSVSEFHFAPSSGSIKVLTPPPSG